MKSKFAWYLNASPENAEKAWEEGILTVDANVLLDLYRYHASTRDSILSAIEAFAPRVWISYQAASEFFGNRKTVIASAEKTFREANQAIDELAKSLEGNLSKLRGYRLVPRPTLEDLGKSLEAAVDHAKTQINDAGRNHPNYLKDDPILGRIVALFEGKIGSDFLEAERVDLLKEGEKRFSVKIPPGYMDDGKDGERKFGDFFFWSQVIAFAKEADLPIILVTSEQKEDWWEKSSGKTLGPRMEMIQEFYTKAGQQAFIYQTDNFLEISASRSGNSIKAEVVEEIREVNAQRTRPFKSNPPAANVEQLSHYASSDENVGTIEIELLREVVNITGSGRFEPEMACTPSVSARVVEAPDGCPPFDVRAGTGTTFDFNVHIRAIARGDRLPVGHYVVEYEAVCDTDSTIAQSSIEG